MIVLIAALLGVVLQTAQPTPAGVDFHLSLRWQEPRTCNLLGGKYREVVADVEGTRLNVRQLPTTASAIIGGVSDGDALLYMPAVSGEAVGIQGDDWYPVRLPGDVRGYVYAPLLYVDDFTWSC